MNRTRNDRIAKNERRKSARDRLKRFTASIRKRIPDARPEERERLRKNIIRMEKELEILDDRIW
jgi:hypothetical protein